MPDLFLPSWIAVACSSRSVHAHEAVSVARHGQAALISHSISRRELARTGVAVRLPSPGRRRTDVRVAVRTAPRAVAANARGVGSPASQRFCPCTHSLGTGDPQAGFAEECPSAQPTRPGAQLPQAIVPLRKIVRPPETATMLRSGDTRNPRLATTRLDVQRRVY